MKSSKLILVFAATLLQGACLTGPDDGETVEFRWTWKQTANGLFDRVHPGSYNVIARLTDSAGRQSGKLPIEINAAP